MNIRMNLLIAASAIALAAGPAFAGSHEKGEGKKMDPAKKFEAIDADSSGSLTLEEVKAHVEKKHKDDDKDVDMAKVEEHFAEIDGDDNGEISMDEWKAAYAKKKEKEKEGEEKKDDGGE